MNTLERPLLFAAVLLAGCGTTRNVAVSSYHVTRGAAVGSYKVARAVAVGSYRVASAPVRYATGRSRSEPTMVGTTEATSSDVTQPGQPMPPQTAAERRQSRTSSEVPRTTRKETAQSSTRSGSSRASAPQENFPTAKAVPDKPGYVFSPFASERYVDV